MHNLLVYLASSLPAAPVEFSVHLENFRRMYVKLSNNDPYTHTLYILKNQVALNLHILRITFFPVLKHYFCSTLKIGK